MVVEIRSVIAYGGSRKVYERVFWGEVNFLSWYVFLQLMEWYASDLSLSLYIHYISIKFFNKKYEKTKINKEQLSSWGPEIGECLACSGDSKEASVTAAGRDASVEQERDLSGTRSCVWGFVSISLVWVSSTSYLVSRGPVYLWGGWRVGGWGGSINSFYSTLD